MVVFRQARVRVLGITDSQFELVSVAIVKTSSVPCLFMLVCIMVLWYTWGSRCRKQTDQR